MGILMFSSLAFSAGGNKQSESPSMALLEFLAELEEIDGQYIGSVDMPNADTTDQAITIDKPLMDEIVDTINKENSNNKNQEKIAETSTQHKTANAEEVQQ